MFVCYSYNTAIHVLVPVPVLVLVLVVVVVVVVVVVEPQEDPWALELLTACCSAGVPVVKSTQKLASPKSGIQASETICSKKSRCKSSI